MRIDPIHCLNIVFIGNDCDAINSLFVLVGSPKEHRHRHKNEKNVAILLLGFPFLKLFTEPEQEQAAKNCDGDKSNQGKIITPKTHKLNAGWHSKKHNQQRPNRKFAVI